MGGACAVMRLELVVVDRIARMEAGPQFAIRSPSTVKYSITEEPVRMTWSVIEVVMPELLETRKFGIKRLETRVSKRTT
jgi:hypothetical protein